MLSCGRQVQVAALVVQRQAPPASLSIESAMIFVDYDECQYADADDCE